ncbi:hypothetical protein GNI_046400 [Gregarina niphandrodes]|uniref:Uncharacterized protein n=1 Tax=Gregarina niphandrodes TaxID=110365 RepID=A0A023B9S0_GRENI|nr:hypothetical protein GNI_046400 [Gregarina niphandrodes]EZG75436.1 hypothetical protein GNI_046400 [Gregarina niphandrodes]|eukprot:XP_011129610.1 hypothetical protein GNI_046400 [Gregarina niphandrodes]
MLATESRRKTEKRLLSAGASVLAVASVLGDGVWMDWAERYWELLGPEKFGQLKTHLSPDPWRRRKHWRTFLQQPSNSVRFDQWTLLRNEEGTRPLYIPTLPTPTQLGSRLLCWSLKNRVKAGPKTGAKPDSNARVETASGTEFAGVCLAGAPPGYDAYCTVRSTLPETGWENLRRVTPATFNECNLAYVEVGGVISSCFGEPYGTVDVEVREEVEHQLGRGASRLRNWLTGCLLKHAGGSLTDLAGFCALVLKINPSTPQGCVRDQLRDGLSIEEATLKGALCSKQLDCLRSGPPCFSDYSRRFNFNENRLEVWKLRLDDLPTVSVAEYATMQQSDLDRILSHRAPPSGPIEQERAWVRRYWELLNPEEYARLSVFVDPAPHRRRARWLRVAPQLISPTDGETEWSMISEIGDVGDDRPFYIPELGVMKTMARSRGYFWGRDYEAYRALHGLLGRDKWAKLRAVKPAHFLRCAQGYLRLAAAFHRCYVAPFGILDTPLLTFIAREMKIPTREPRFAYWISGCLLQYCEMPFEDLLRFCDNHFRFTPVPSARDVTALQNSVCVDMHATAQALAHLPVLTIAEYCGLEVGEHNRRDEYNLPKFGGSERPTRKRRHTSNHTDNGSNLENATKEFYENGKQHGNAAEPWLQQLPTSWSKWLETPQVQELAELPAVKYVCTNHWPQLSRCIATLAREESEERVDTFSVEMFFWKKGVKNEAKKLAVAEQRPVEYHAAVQYIPHSGPVAMSKKERHELKKSLRKQRERKANPTSVSLGAALDMKTPEQQASKMQSLMAHQQPVHLQAQTVVLPTGASSNSTIKHKK